MTTIRKKTKTLHSRGFTIIEAIMSFTILSLALAGFSGMVVASIQGFRLSQERFVAAKIAQEGMELAQNKKDNHVQCVAADPSCPISNWQENLLGDFQVESTRINDLRPVGQFSTFNFNNYICIIQHPSVNAGKYGYCGGSDYLGPKYTREVRITSIDSSSVSVVTTVRWGTNKSLVLQSILFSTF